MPDAPNAFKITLAVPVDVAAHNGERVIYPTGLVERAVEIVVGDEVDQPRIFGLPKLGGGIERPMRACRESLIPASPGTAGEI